MNAEDYTQTLWSVMRAESFYPKELKDADLRRLAEEWAAINEPAISEMEGVAMRLHAAGKRLSSKYLIERQRMEGVNPFVPVLYVDEYGEEHRYAMSNSLSPWLARELRRRHPDWKFKTKKSLFDRSES